MDLGFTYQTSPSGEVAIQRGGQTVTILRGEAARRFRDTVTKADADEAQQTMARVTGNYRRGNERQAKGHSRNR